MSQDSQSRRAFFKAMAAGATGAVVPIGFRAEAAAGGPTIWSAEYWAQKGTIQLNLWRKRTASRRGAAARRRLRARLVSVVAHELRSRRA
jgi:hypothetical protein